MYGTHELFSGHPGNKDLTLKRRQALLVVRGWERAHRAMFCLKWYDGFSDEDIAEIFEMTPYEVEKLLNEMKANLENELIWYNYVRS